MSSTSEFSLQELVEKLYIYLGDVKGAPSLEMLKKACDVLYSSSLLKEEGRSVRARIIIAPPDEFLAADGPPDGFLAADGPPDGFHAVRFANLHPFTSNEIKRLSPAASFVHSVIAIWPDRDRGFKIWGILNTGPRWMNIVGGGRKPQGKVIPRPIIHVRDPGWLLFYQGYDLMAEWRGRQFHGPRMDVFQSKLLGERFAGNRQKFVERLMECCLPSSLDARTYGELARLISLQFIKRVVNLVRTSGHGGSLVFLPEAQEGLEPSMNWIDCKYTVEPDVAGMRFGILIEAIIRRIGELCAEGSSISEAWSIFRNSSDPELDRLEEAFFEFARLLSDLMQVDGALVLDKRVRVIGFGGEIRVDRNVLMVGQAQDLEGNAVIAWNVQGDGTRHRSVYRLCSVEPEAIGFVISQDSQVRMVANVGDSVIVWPHTVI